MLTSAALFRLAFAIAILCIFALLLGPRAHAAEHVRHLRREHHTAHVDARNYRAYWPSSKLVTRGLRGARRHRPHAELTPATAPVDAPDQGNSTFWQGDSNAAYWGRERAREAGRGPVETIGVAALHGLLGTALRIKDALDARVRAVIGARWIPVAERIVKVESGFRPNAVGPHTKYGRALGLGQLLLASARKLGYQGDARGLLNAQINIDLTVAHMRECIAAGVATDSDMAGCHVAGWANFRSRSRYANKYRRMVEYTRV